MRFAQDSFATNSIRAYRDGEITVNEKVVVQSVLITPDIIQPWAPRSIDELAVEHLEPLIELNPEIAIIGTGQQLQFPAARIMAGLQTKGIGAEIMTNDAACRTFNILLAEDRRVLVALLMG